MLLTLPPELLLSISEHLPPSSLAALLRCNHRLHALLSPLLYRLCASHAYSLLPTPPSPSPPPSPSLTTTTPSSSRARSTSSPSVSNTRDSTHAPPTALHSAAARGLTKALSRLLEYSTTHLNTHDSWSRTPLLLAARGGHEGAVRVLLAYGCDTEARASGRCESALDYAAEGGHEGVLKALLGFPDPDDDDDNDEPDASLILGGMEKLAVTPATTTAAAAAAGDAASSAKRVRTPADARPRPLVNVDATDFSSWTALQKAAYRHHRRCVALLQQAGADVNHRSPDGRTALHRFARRQDLVGVRILLDAGADKRLRDADGNRAVDVARRELRWLLRVMGGHGGTAQGEAQTIFGLLDVVGE